MPHLRGAVRSGEEGRCHLLHVEQLGVEHQHGLGRSTKYVDIGRSNIVDGHDSDFPTTNKVRTLTEAVVGGEGGKNKVGASNLKF